MRVLGHPSTYHNPICHFSGSHNLVRLTQSAQTRFLYVNHRLPVEAAAFLSRFSFIPSLVIFGLGLFFSNFIRERNGYGVIIRRSGESRKQRVSTSIVNRKFSFKDAVLGSSQTSMPASFSGHTEHLVDTKLEKKQGFGPRLIRSRSITKIVESPSFKKRCEVLQAHQRHTEEEHVIDRNNSLNQDSGKKLTPLDESCEHEHLLLCSSACLEEHQQSSRSTSKCYVSSPSDKDKETNHGSDCLTFCDMPTDTQKASVSLDVAHDNNTLEVSSDSSCGSSSTQTMKYCSRVPVSCQSSTGYNSACSHESELSQLSHDLAVECSVKSTPLSQKVFDSDDDFLDCDDTNSESTAESSCPSPHHSPQSHFGSHRLSDVYEMEAGDEESELLHVLSSWDEEDEEAYLLLDHINELSIEFTASREYEESNALTWLVQQAAQRGVISASLQQNLLSSICEGNLDEARDVLYHKCHLIPAVGCVVESPMQPTMDEKTLQSFEAYVNHISPIDIPEARMHKLRVLKQLSDLLTMWVKMDRIVLEQTPGISQLSPLPNAYMPLISLSFSGVRMDLLFARLPVSSVEANQNIDSDHMLIGVQETSMKALNAPRVSSMLLCLVPKRREYRIVLRSVRAWARRRGIYSAKLGYLGGISWAILVAFVCQLYPNAEPGKIFVRFFQVLSEWQWPQPVMLNMIYDAALGFDMWDPRQNVYDRSHVMPIITPAYPHMNSSVQVSQSTFLVIYEELWRARYLAEIAVGISKPFPTTSSSSENLEGEIAKAAMVCRTTSVPFNTVDMKEKELDAVHADEGDDISAWGQLFQSSNFFLRYNSYMVFNFNAESEGAMLKWGKFVQSRLRKLVDNLYHMAPVSRVHAYPCYFPQICGRDCTGPGSCMFIGIEFHCRQHKSVQPKDDPEVKKTLEQTIRFFLATDLQQMEDKQPDMTADALILNWDELPDFVFREGRGKAELERAQYTRDLEIMGYTQGNTPSFRPPYYVNSFQRNGKWRSGNLPRKYSGGQRKQRRDFLTSARSNSPTQCG
ncbi:poly polymerase [Plasmopara halstedii]|uniref:polynucleotide adenylyltransferase n=1 Tax=Plasmopara halstedii TaxID=4781 RepID=A0A0P1AE62_PLAHL|nr:poly polymerase [Plasmopara halstedii]CEG39202.1 poly polymerase [Plasmopara halstedii]|eukprot:XP_024575571.1 poly polymerase [Plasmopara halstedii]